MATLTIRDVPDDVKDALARSARERGQSLQALLLSVLQRQARFEHNRELLIEIERDLAAGGGAGADAPDAAEMLERGRAESQPDVGASTRTGGAA